MASIFEFVRQGKKTSSTSESSAPETKNVSSIFEAAKEMPEQKEPTRLQSLSGAPIKGFMKGVKDASEFYRQAQDPIGSLIAPGTGPVPSEIQSRLIEEAFPTQNKAPERLLERAGKVGSYLIGPGKVISKIIRGGIATVGGQLAKEFGFSEPVQSAVEIGALLSPTTLRGAQKHISSLYNQAESLAGDAKIPTKNLVKNIRNFIADLSKGGPAASKNAAMEQAKSVLQKINKGEIEVKELTEFKKTINEARSSLYGDQKLDKGGRRAAKRNLDEVSKVVDNSLGEYGKINPEWNELYRAANEGHGAIANSKKVSNWIARTIKQNPHVPGSAIAGSLIGHALAPTVAPAVAAKAAGAIAVGYTGIKSAELIARIMKSKVLRKYYKNVINEAVKENTSGFLNNIRKLEKSLEESDKKED